MIRRPLSIRTRLTLWSSLFLGLAITSFSMVVYTLAASSLRAEVQRKLDEAFRTVAAVIQDEVDDLEDIEEHDAVALFAVSLGDHTLYVSSGWRTSHLDDALPQDRSQVFFGRRTRGERSFRLRAEPVVAHGQSFLAAVAVDESASERSLGVLASVLALGTPIALLLSIVGGYFLTGRLLAPVAAIAEKARHISAERLSDRLPIANPDDELGQLAMIFNEALARLEDAFGRLLRFTSDASHELRTPLTAIRSVGEVALRDNLDAEAYRDVIGSMLEEVDRLVRLVENLLTLTRGDSGRWILQKQRTNLADFAESVVNDLSVLAEEKGQTLRVEADGAVWTEIDPAVLRQALINLVDNAVKHTPKGGTIRVIVNAPSLEESLVEVIDQGPGIPLEHRASVFERFMRVDLGRSKDAGGAGLGLSIAKWAVEANGGRIELESDCGRGSIFRIVLPTGKGEKP